MAGLESFSKHRIQQDRAAVVLLPAAGVPDSHVALSPILVAGLGTEYRTWVTWQMLTSEQSKRMVERAGRVGYVETAMQPVFSRVESVPLGATWWADVAKHVCGCAAGGKVAEEGREGVDGE